MRGASYRLASEIPLELPSGSARMKERAGACSGTTRKGRREEANGSMAMDPTILALGMVHSLVCW